MMYKIIKTGVGLLIFYSCIGKVSAQIVQKIGDQPFVLNNSAVLELQSITKGFLPPRMTAAQRDAILKPAKGLTIYNMSTDVVEVNTGTLDIPSWTAATFNYPSISNRLTANYTILNTDSTVLFDTTAQSLTVTLPNATGLTGKIFYVRKDDASANTLTIAPQLLSGGVVVTIVLNYSKTIKLQSNGTNWVVID